MTWLNSALDEAEIKNQMDRLQFTSEMPQPQPAFSYSTGISCSYGFAVALMGFILFRRLWRMARHGASIGFGRRRTTNFFIRQIPVTLAVTMWSGFLLGSVIAGVISGLLWITT